ncbi:hypothetical protein SELMODRAFT_426654 [Selaginella moellendorffii]|uniref:Uncharacterized protein n=1 Tax=Selaginella moellendorffii TaxID=88036 RepID=D8SX28_SELML|nr:hypothetical protein SELMODRAFT_426654 [Selaginella moellendorffii]
MSKRRIAARTFGFQRHPVYKTSCMVEPLRECTYYAPEEERLNKDVDGFIREIHDKRRDRDKEILACNKVARAYEEYKLVCKREEAWDKEKLRDEFFRVKPHGRTFSNRSAVKYDIFTMEYEDSFYGRQFKHEDDLARFVVSISLALSQTLMPPLLKIENFHRWRQTLRKLFLQARSSGVPDFNIVDWRRLPAPVEPARPRPPGPDPAKALHGLEMQRFKPVAVEPGDIVPGDGKTAELLHFSPIPHQRPLASVRDVIVNVEHPWQHCC